MSSSILAEFRPALDIEKQMEAVQSLQSIIDLLSGLKRNIMVRYDTTIEEHVSRGIMESDGFRIEPTFGNREIDVLKVKRQKEWQSLILDSIITEAKFTDLEVESERDALVDALQEYIRQLNKLEYHAWRDDQLIQEESS